MRIWLMKIESWQMRYKCHSGKNSVYVYVHFFIAYIILLLKVVGIIIQYKCIITIKKTHMSHTYTSL